MPHLLADIEPGADSSFPTDFVDFGGETFFIANTELWKTDGTSAGTQLVLDTGEGVGSTSLEGLSVHNDSLVFARVDSGPDPSFSATDDDQFQVWKSDGTPGGTEVVRDFGVGSSSGASEGSYFASASGEVFFAVGTSGLGNELWKTDLSSPGTVLVKDINPGPDGSRPTYLHDFNGTLFFAADDGASGSELWKSDGTSAGTVLVKDLDSAGGSYPSSYPDGFAELNGEFFFGANSSGADNTFFTPDDTAQLWKSDGTTAGTVLVKDFGPGSSRVDYLTAVGDAIFGAVSTPDTGTELWKSDGTEAGTTLVKDINASVGAYSGSYPSDLTAVGDTLFFSADDGVNGRELWKSDGTSAGTVLVKDIMISVGSYGDGGNPQFFENVNGTLYFAAEDDSNGVELWKSDGTSSGTVLVADINPSASSPQGSYPYGLAFVNGSLFFGADDGTNGFEPWALEPMETEPPTEIIVDNNDSGATVAGAWTSSTTVAGFIDGDYLFNRTPGSDNVTFTPTLAEDGLYEVSARWTSDPNRATNAPITVVHRDGSSLTVVDQQQNGGEWVSLGQFNLLVGAGHNVMVGMQGINGVVIADAVQFVRIGDVEPLPEPSDEIIVDNNDAGAAVAGAWMSSTTVAGFIDGDYLFNRTPGSDKVTFTPTLAEDGLYEVSARWTSDPNRATNAPITVVHRDGSSLTRVDQQQNGGEWVSLGQFNLLVGAGHNVMVGMQGTNGVVTADAVQFVRVGDAEPLPEPSDEIIVDNNDAGAAVAGAWMSSTTVAGFIDGDYLFNRTPGSDKVTFTPTLAEDGLYEVSARWTSDPNRATNAPITVVHRDGSSLTRVDQQQNGGEWVSLGQFNLLVGAGHNVMVGMQGINGVVIADAVQFVRIGDVEPLPEPSDDIIVDNNDAGAVVAGAWMSSTTVAGFIDGDYLFNRTPGSDKVTFTPTLAEDGLYEVSARWTSDPNRATNAPITVVHRDGSSLTRVDQQQNGGEWVSLGQFNLLVGAGHNVMVGMQGTNGVVIADAVQFVRIGDSTERGTLSVVAVGGDLTTSETGDTLQLSFEIDRQPAADVIVALSIPDASEASLSATEVRFTPTDFSTPKIVTVTGEDDVLFDGDVSYEIVVGAAESIDPIFDGVMIPSVSAVNLDDEVGAFDGLYQGNAVGTAVVPGVGSIPVDVLVEYVVSGLDITVSQPTDGTGTISESGEITFGVVGAPDIGSCDFDGSFDATDGGASGSWQCPNLPGTSGGFASGTWQADQVNGVEQESEGEAAGPAAERENAVDAILAEWN